MRWSSVPLLPQPAVFTSRGSVIPSPSLAQPPVDRSRSQQLAAESLVLLRQTTSNLLMQVAPAAASIVRTFRCAICLENVREEERVIFVACGDPSHGCCRDCMRQYVKGLVADGKVDSIQCPCSRACKGVATEREIQLLTDAETFSKYKRFQQMQQDPTLRQCHVCGRLVKPLTDKAGAIIAEMMCPCGAEFCYYHSNAHIGKPCEEYRKAMAKEERVAMQGAMKGTKPCPQCGIITEKISGCNHMTCGTCKTHWCWVCGKSFENISWHYNPGNLSGCLQFQESESLTGTLLFRFLRLLMLPVVVFSLLLFFVCSLTLIFWLLVAAILVGPCTAFDPTVVLACAAGCAYTPMLIFQVVWICIAFVLYGLFLPCGASQEHLVFLLQVPMASVMGCVEGAGGAVHH